jgi:CHAT domain-containing protein
VVSQSTFQNVVFTLALRQASPEFLAFAADVLVRWKQVQGEEEAFMARLVRTSGDPALQTLGKEIMTLRGDLGRLVNTPEPDPAALRASHEALETKELELARRSRPYEQHLKIRSADVDDVRAHLPQDSVLLELRLYAPVDFNTGTMRALHWLALFLPAVPDGDQEFVLEDLGPVAETQALWEMLRQRGERDTALHLYQRVFGRFEDRLKDVKTLYIAPDGVMHLVALSRLVLPDGRYWVERQTLRQLQTGRDLLASRSEQVPKGLVALGAIDYGTFGEPSSAGTDPQQRTLHRQLTQEIGALRPLAYSGPEVQEIAQYYWDRHGGQAQVWSASDASETRLKTLPTPPRVLHLATHGFYLSHHAATVERPMVLSGVALAGANQGMTGRRSAEGEDGILYALEAQGLNLEGTELVALSACDTGKGTVDYSEGVYGLVRAFRTAGVRRVLMTLWPVDDAMARDFMTRFYAHWLPDQGEPALALQKTRLEFLHHADPTRRDPKVWAPYVLVETR